jgi:hypothetical protein
MSLPSERVWLDIICLAIAVTLLEGAVTGRGTTRGRPWPVSLRLRPLFAVVGFGLLAFAIVDFFRRFSNWGTTPLGAP